jgi:hypothetical protein
MEWFDTKGVSIGSPQEIAEQMVEQHRKSIIRKTGHNLDVGPWLSRRGRALPLLHVNASSKTI